MSRAACSSTSPQATSKNEVFASATSRKCAASEEPPSASQGPTCNLTHGKGFKFQNIGMDQRVCWITMDCVITHKYIDWRQMDCGTVAMSVNAGAGVVGTTVWRYVCGMLQCSVTDRRRLVLQLATLPGSKFWFAHIFCGLGLPSLVLQLPLGASWRQQSAMNFGFATVLVSCSDGRFCQP